MAPRHRSMKAAFDHSWALLSAEERTVLAQLALFRGGFRREEAAAVTGVNLYMLASLIDKSLQLWPRQQQLSITKSAALTLIRHSPRSSPQARRSVTPNAR